MAANYRIKYKLGDLEFEIESTDKAFVESKLQELIQKPKGITQKNPTKQRPSPQPKQTKPEANATSTSEESEFDIMAIVNAINASPEHNTIEEKILKKSNQLNRILLVFYFVNKVYDQNTSITTGDVEKITDQLGIRIKRANAGTKIKSSSKYFSADSVRKRGAVVKYKLNRKGIEEFEKLIQD